MKNIFCIAMLALLMPMNNVFAQKKDSSSCSYSCCHTSPSPKASLNLSAGVAYSQLFAKSEVDTLNPEKSLLYYHMNSFSGPMPPSGRLDNCTIKLVLRWIDQKAKNN
ncbi:MAG TPA: hypothetical protein VII99_06940 [Bacteroidia bacterium]